MATAIIIALLWVSLCVNVTVGYIAWRAVMEGRGDRAELHTARLAMLAVLQELERIKALERPVWQAAHAPRDDKVFALMISRAVTKMQYEDIAA